MTVLQIIVSLVCSLTLDLSIVICLSTSLYKLFSFAADRLVSIIKPISVHDISDFLEFRDSALSVFPFNCDSKSSKPLLCNAVKLHSIIYSKVIVLYYSASSSSILLK